MANNSKQPELTVEQMIDELERIASSQILRAEARAAAQWAETIIRQLRGELAVKWRESPAEMHRKVSNLNVAETQT